MIYTSYFGNINKIRETLGENNYVLISICGKAPDWYVNNNGLEYKKLAPKYDFFMRWKESGDNNYYISEFNERVLKALNANEVLNALYKKANLDINNDSKYIILLCYEKPGDFCHRHLVSKWFNENGIGCEELCLN